ncbi:MAG: serine/threonine protein kinase [Bacteroidales bacterium]|nr:serine/threonine protein kinase [Bacteroidales bacterium]
MFTQILDAFQYAHSKGIVHRDIKPSNIFISGGNQVKILDFGIAKIFGTVDDFTSTGTQMGTPVYMSPEQVKADKSIDHRSDIYSLGITLFFALNGKPPYDSTTQSSYEIFNKIVLDPVPDLGTDPLINGIIHKAANKDRDQRFQESRDFRDALINYKNSAAAEMNDDKTLIDFPSAAAFNLKKGEGRANEQGYQAAGKKEGSIVSELNEDSKGSSFLSHNLMKILVYLQVVVYLTGILLTIFISDL